MLGNRRKMIAKATFRTRVEEVKPKKKRLDLDSTLRRITEF